jgi:2-hydroxychromene-2-carboxylate isomerase
VNLKLRIRSALMNLVFSEGLLRKKRALAELRRKMMRQPHVVSVFLELDDPYSYLLCHYLPEFAKHFDVELRFYLTEAIGGAMRPAPDLYPEYALNDCRLLAQELGIPFLDKGTQPVERRLALIDALASTHGSPNFKTELIEAITAYWRGDSEAVSRRTDSSGAQVGGALLLEKNQRLLEKLGHYNAATMYYAGEWYWGVDRLHYLAERLTSLHANREPGTPPGLASITQVMQVNLPVKPPAAARKLPPMEFFYSFRSPYSYIALRRCMNIADAFGIEFKVRPVLPMVMRGMQVPRSKLVYIGADASREARRLGVPFGTVADPVGKGVERCLAVLEYAIAEHRERDFLIHAGEAIWSEAVDVATDKGLRQVATRTGLFWPDVLASLEKDEWRTIASDNRQSMMESGSWGVPTIRLGDFVTWGQDRDWLLVRHIEELCDSGDGILV